jgi:glycosyltransferase involved in cell wall biosynthesis
MPAYNYERFIAQALHSALAQDYPADRVEIVVVDDGSTDATAAIVGEIAAAQPGRVQLVQQPNAGQIATVARAFAAATGEVIALLDADDVWLPGKLRRQVELLRERPDIELVFSDMYSIDAAGHTLSATQYQPGEFDVNRLYARILRTNVAYNSSLVFRARMFEPAPDTVCDWDWWLALCAARAGAIAYISEPLAQYRQHGENMLAGAAGPKLIALRRRQLRFQLWALRHLSLTPLRPAELLEVWGGSEWLVSTAKQDAGSHFLDLVTVTDDDRARAELARAEGDQAVAAGNLQAAAALRLRALAWDPFEPGALRALRAAVAAAGAQAV